MFVSSNHLKGNQFISLGAHLNPAVSTAMASIGRLPWKKVPYYFAAQYIAAFLAALVTWLIYGDVVNEFDPGFTQNGSSVYTTFPGEGVSLTAALTDQILCTGLLTFAILAADGPKLARSIHPLYFTLVITGIVIAFNYNAGAILNPARDLGPRVFASVAGYGMEVFKPLSTNYWWLVAVIGPHVGGLIGVWYYILFIDPNVVYEPESLNNQINLNQTNITNVMLTTSANRLTLPEKTHPNIESS
ncbi:aquaporin-3-like isoform X2 [Panonychus citri]|uniref:aquaporin-3-like isoform X2 n=1 Tax=Panonychus citri TaxID=50023 RepID=UPI0023073CF3|nr:aquaporin-3-like isoform X2 [Panonychus citri]